MTRVLIADDELPARQRLRQLLTSYPDIEVVAEAETGTQTMELVAATQPDLLLLDIQMPDGTGLDVAACLPAPQPAVIFCTAFDQHAVDAFELNALDYLLKPVSRTRLDKALARLAAGRTEQSRPAGLDMLGHEVRQSQSRFLVRSGRHYLVVPAAEATYIESVDGLTRLVTDAAHSYWMESSLQEIETRIDASLFFRISRAIIVNVNAVRELHPLPGGSAAVLLKDGTQLEVSRRRVRDLLSVLEKG